MQAKRTTIGALAIASTFFACLGAQAALIDIELFPSDPEVRILQAPAIMQPVEPIHRIQSLPAVMEQAPATVTTAQNKITTPVIEPGASHPLIKSCPSCVPGNLSTTESFFGLKFMDRLSDMMEQVELGSSRGWLTADERASLEAERQRIADLINCHSGGALTSEEIAEIERALTGFNQLIAHELNDMEGSVAVGPGAVPF